MAINREEICEKIFIGARTPAKDFTSPVLDGWTENVEGNEVLDHDDTKAKQLWADANDIDEWDGKFQIAYNTDGAGNKEYTEAVANQLKNTLGIDASPKVYPTFDELRKDVTERTIKTAFRTGWQADYPSMLNYLGPIYADRRRIERRRLRQQGVRQAHRRCCSRGGRRALQADRRGPGDPVQGPARPADVVPELGGRDAEGRQGLRVHLAVEAAVLQAHEVVRASRQ